MYLKSNSHANAVVIDYLLKSSLTLLCCKSTVSSRLFFSLKPLIGSNYLSSYLQRFASCKAWKLISLNSAGKKAKFIFGLIYCRKILCEQLFALEKDALDQNTNWMHMSSILFWIKIKQQNWFCRIETCGPVYRFCKRSRLPKIIFTSYSTNNIVLWERAMFRSYFQKNDANYREISIFSGESLILSLIWSGQYPVKTETGYCL